MLSEAASIAMGGHGGVPQRGSNPLQNDVVNVTWVQFDELSRRVRGQLSTGGWITLYNATPGDNKVFAAPILPGIYEMVSDSSVAH